MRYEVRDNPDGKGKDVWFVNDLPNPPTEHAVWERLTPERAAGMAEGGNYWLKTVADAARCYQDDVRAFHEKFNHIVNDRPTTLAHPDLNFRAKLIREEAGEVVEAIDQLILSGGDEAVLLGKVAAELCDLLYVVFGGFVNLGIKAAPCFAIVQKANMAKNVNPDGGKPVKPAGWESPELHVVEEVKRQISGKEAK